MNSINLKHAALSSVIVYILGILAYVGSFFIPLYVLFLFVCLYSFILGSGKLGIDLWISRKLGSRIKKKK
jgi:hypothetical protein